MEVAKGSMDILKMSGDNGQLCRVPFDMRNGCDIAPVVETIAKGHECRDKIANNIHPLRPNLIRT